MKLKRSTFNNLFLIFLLIKSIYFVYTNSVIADTPDTPTPQYGFVTVYAANGTFIGTYTTIQAGINHCPDGGTVICADGIYTGPENKNLSWTGKKITVCSENKPDNCIIDCEGSGNGFNFGNADDYGTISGFTIKNGSTTYGGGINCRHSSLTIVNCIISGNTADYGGGICGGNPTITNCTISENTATYDGGGIYCSLSSPTIINCTISGNTAKNGGGIHCYDNSSPTIINCIISENTVTEKGGGICCDYYCSPVITNCTISGNTAGHGGGICCRDSYPKITNNIITNNSNYGIYNLYGNPAIDYNDVWNNTLGNYYDCSAGAHDISSDPQFINPTDFHLKTNSSCIDAGSNTAPAIPLTDKDNNPRIVDGNNDDVAIVDMGAYEFQGVPPSQLATITGIISYYGTKTGTLYYAASDNSKFEGDAVAMGTTTWNGPGSLSYTLEVVGTTAPYYIGALIDADNSADPISVGDPIGIYGTLTAAYWVGQGPLKIKGIPTPVYVNAGSVTSGINFELTHEVEPLTAAGTITKVGTPTEVYPEGTITYTIRYHNSGSMDLTGVRVIDYLPYKIMFATSNPAYSSWYQAESMDWVYIWDIGTLTPCQQGTITIVAKVASSAEHCEYLENEVRLYRTLGEKLLATATYTIHVTTIPAAPVADFIGSPTSGTRPLQVQFTDQSIGSITSWYWQFGDGATSTQQNPAHTYTTTGTYTVSLKVTGPGGSDTKIKSNYIKVYEPIPANQLPIAYIDSIAPSPGTYGTVINFVGHGADTDGTIIAYLWQSDIVGTLSDKSTFATSTLPVGTHNISFWVWDNLGMRSEEPATATLVIISIFSGYVTTLLDDTIIGGPVITVIKGTDTVIASGISVINGSFVIYHIEPGTYTVYASVTSTEGAISSIWTDVKIPSRGRFKFILPVGYKLSSLSGKVPLELLLKKQSLKITESQILQKEVVIELYLNNRLIATTTPDNHGKFLFKGLLPNKYTIKIKQNGILLKEKEIILHKEEDLILDLREDKLGFPEDKVIAYPNPTTLDYVVISFYCDIEMINAKITIYDISGNLVRKIPMQELIEEPKNTYKYILRIKDISSGVYIYKVWVKTENNKEYEVIKKLAIIK